MTMDDDDEIMDAVLDSPTEQPAPAPAPASPTPAPASGGVSDDDDDDEYYDDDDDYGGFMDDIYEKLAFGPLDGRHTFKLLIIGFVVLILMLSLVSQSIGFQSGCSKVTVDIRQPETVNDNDFEFFSYISPPFMGRIDRSDAQYTIKYDGDIVYQGSFPYNDNNKGQDEIPLVDFYVDNGEYTVKVTACGQSDSDFQEVIRTIKVVEPEMTLVEPDDDKNNDYLLIGLGLRGSDEIGDDYKPPTRGNGTMKLYYSEDDDFNSGKELRETVTFEIDMQVMEWVIDSTGEKKTETHISLGREYWYEGEDGYYKAFVDFTNTFSKSEDADTEMKKGRSNTIEDFDD